MTRVILSRREDYSPESLNKVVDNFFQKLGVYEEIKPGMTVVLKPNLVIASRPEEAAITHPALTEAVGKCVQRAGGKVLIAESPGGPYTPGAMRSIFKRCGYTDMAKANGFSLYTDCESREVFLPEGVRCRRAAIVTPFLERDYLIDLSKLKTHCMMGLSGAVKNMFGAVPGLQKPELHCRFPQKEDFAQMLVDICGFLKPDLSIIDGIWAMEGDGPTGGRRRDLGVLIASKNPFAADVCAASLIGLKAEENLPLLFGARRGFGPLKMEELELLGESVKSCAQPDFQKAKASSTDFIDRLPKFLRPAVKKLATPYPKINGKECMGCGKCAESCPQHTISIREGRAQIAYQNCIRCFCCHEMCPKHVIDVKRWNLLRW